MGWLFKKCCIKAYLYLHLADPFYPKRLTQAIHFFCQYVCFPGNIKCKVDWKEGKLGRKMCTSNRNDTSLRILSSKAYSNTCERFTGVNWSWSQYIKSHHAQTSSGKGLPSHIWNRNIVRSILPGLRRKRTGPLLSGPKSVISNKVHFAFHLEIKVWSL